MEAATHLGGIATAPAAAVPASTAAAAAATVRFAMPAAVAAPRSPPPSLPSASASASLAAGLISPSKRLLGFAAMQQLRSMPSSPRGLARGGSAPSVLPAAQLALSDQHTFFGVDLAALELSGDPLELPPRDPLPQHTAADATEAAEAADAADAALLADLVGPRDAHDPAQGSTLQQLAAELEVAESSTLSLTLALTNPDRR